MVVSDAVLKELEYKLHYKISYFCNRCNFQIIKSKKQDYELARKIEKGCNYRLSFMDCIHIAISKRLDCVLVTRDAELLWEAKGYVSSAKPEDLLD